MAKYGTVPTRFCNLAARFDMRCATCKAPTADEITPHLYYGFLIKPQTGHTVIFGSAEPEIPEALRVQVGNQYAFMWRKGQLPNNQTPHVLNVSVAPAATTSALLSNYASEFPVGEAGAWVESGVSETAVYETVQRTLYPFAGQAVAVRETIGTAETLTYLYNDHLGSAAIMTDDAGVVVDGSVTKYYPFGSYRERPTTNPTTTTLGFTGHRHDDGAGLIYANARYYLPQIGRFASADTLVPEPANPQSFNRYSYVYNSVMAFRDPQGHAPVCAVQCIVTIDGIYGTPVFPRHEFAFKLAVDAAAEYEENNFGVIGRFNTYHRQNWETLELFEKQLEGYSSPDFIALSVDFPYAGIPVWSQDFTLTIDKFGNAYFGTALQGGYSPLFGFSGSITSGQIRTENEVTSASIHEYLAGPSYSVNGGIIIGGGITVVPHHEGWAVLVERGLYFPGFNIEMPLTGFSTRIYDREYGFWKSNAVLRFLWQGLQGPAPVSIYPD